MVGTSNQSVPEMAIDTTVDWWPNLLGISGDSVDFSIALIGEKPVNQLKIVRWDSGIFNDSSGWDSGIFNDSSGWDSGIFNDSSGWDSGIFNDSSGELLLGIILRCVIKAYQTWQAGKSPNEKWRKIELGQSSH